MRILTASLLAVICVEAIAIGTLIYKIESEVQKINIEVDNIVDASTKLDIDDRSLQEALIKEIDELDKSNKILYEKVVKRQKEIDEEQDRLNKIKK